MASITNEGYAINYLRYWYDATPLPALGFISFSTAIDYYRNQGSFLDQLGGTVKGIRQDKVQAVFEQLAKEFGTNYPKPADFFDALVKANKPDARDVLDSVETGVAQAGKAITIGASAYLIMIALVAVIAIYPELKRA